MRNLSLLPLIRAVSRLGGVIWFDALHLRVLVSISQDPSGNRDHAIERATRRGLPKRGVALVTLELAA